MRAIVYSEAGDPGVLRLTDRAVPEPGPGEVRVKVAVSGVNPSDWKSRRRDRTGPGEQVPNQDGAGTVDATGPGVTGLTAGQRVWLYDTAWQRAEGTAQEYVVVPAVQAAPLPDHASFDLGASLGVPALTAQRCLTVSDGGPQRLRPGALAGRVVLVAGGAGAVGNAAIQLARWAGATVLTTVSGPRKADLARAAGAHHVVNYRTDGATGELRRLAPGGVDVVVEVAPAPNIALDQAVLAENSTISVYAADGGADLVLPLRAAVLANTRLQFVQIYAVPPAAKLRAVADVGQALVDGALRVGEEAGLPLHRFPLERTADAHAAVEAGAVGKVLIDVG